MEQPDPLNEIAPRPPVRMLMIEADGDPWKGLIKPKIRLMGRWLERAGFRPGNRVNITCVAPGIIELHATGGSMNESKLASAGPTEDPL